MSNQLLTKSEQEWIMSSPQGLADLINFHDNQIMDVESSTTPAELEALGIDPYYHHNRVKELLDKGRAIIASDPDCYTDADKELFKQRYSER